MDKKDVRQKLIDLGAEQLADALLGFSSTNDEVSETINRLIATPQENSKRFKAKLAGLKRLKKFYDWRTVNDFAGELEGMLSDLQMGVSDPKTGVEMVGAFYECDLYIFDHCDDSSGTIGDIFRFNALDIFTGYATKCTDKKWICQELLKIYKKDDYGIRDVLINNAVKYLPPEFLRILVDNFWKFAAKETPHSFEARHWLYAIASLAKQLGDPQLFEKATLAAWPKISVAFYIDIAQVYLDNRDVDKALDWMQKIPDNETFKKEEQNRLLLAIYETLGDKDRLAEIAWKIFLNHRDKDNLNKLISIIGESERRMVISEQTQQILKSQQYSYANAMFLIDMERFNEAEEYVIINSEQLNGDLYTSLLPIGERLEKAGRLIGTVIIYRALLDSILRRAQSTYYHHGVRYLKKLDSLATKITDWKNIQPHEDYKQGIVTAHARKSSFWAKYKD